MPSTKEICRIVAIIRRCLVFWCMLLLLGSTSPCCRWIVPSQSSRLAWTTVVVHAFSTSVVPSNRGLSKAFVVADPTGHQRRTHHHRHQQQNRLEIARWLFSLSASNSNVNGEGSSGLDKNKQQQQQQQGCEGITGWTHNTPSASSPFWKSNNNAPTAKSSSSNNQSNQLRTGWLHNTVSPSEKADKNDKKDTPSLSSTARRRLELAMKQQQRNHRIVAPPAFHATTTGKVVVTTEHMMSVPLVRSNLAAGTTKKRTATRLDVFFTIVEHVDTTNVDEWTWWQTLVTMRPAERAAAYVQQAALTTADSLVLYLQGGPGFGAPTPVVGLGFSTKDASWAAAALDQAPYKRVVLMDQRGTGRSCPITKQALQLQFPDLFVFDNDNNDNHNDIRYETLDDFLKSPGHDETKAALVKTAIAEATNYVSHFRADNIVQDAEEIRDALLLPGETEQDEANRPWGCTLGQSYGGFCIMTYLSQVQHPPKICLFTGGIAPMLSPLDQVYASLWDRVQERNLQFYEMYPGDVSVVKRIVRMLLESPAKLPSGGTLTARRFLQLGLGLGGTPSTFASLHALLASALIPTGNEQDAEFSRSFLKRIDVDQSFDDHPIYFWLHESIYADQSRNSPTNWSAHRMYEKRVHETLGDDFDYRLTSDWSDDRPTLFFGEMVFPWMVEDYTELSGLGLREMAHALATKTDWGPLYDANAMKQALESGKSRAAAAVYYNDMYVDFDACAAVFARNGPLGKCKVWINNEYQHSGLRDNGAMIFGKLHGMATGSIRTPS